MDVPKITVQNMYAVFLLRKEDLPKTEKLLSEDITDRLESVEESRLMTETVRPVSSIYNTSKVPNRDDLPEYLGQKINLYK